MINPFPTIYPTHLLFFFYGAACMFLSFSIGIKNMGGSNLRIAGSLWLLAVFGFMHGAHDWIEIYPLIEGEHLTIEHLFAIKFLSVALMTVSFLFLLLFGLSLSLVTKRTLVKWTIGVSLALYLIGVLSAALHWSSFNMSILQRAVRGVDNIFGLVGGAVTSYGLIRYSYSREIKSLSQSISRYLSYAGIVFAFYGIFSSSFFAYLSYFLIHLQPEIFRGGAAVLIAYLIMKALNIFDVETRMKVESQTRRLAQSEKLASLGRLAAGIAHEINNPLTNASLGVQLLRKNPGGHGGRPSLDEKLNAVERNIDRASAIAQELLQISRQQEAEFLPVNINEVIAGALMLMKHRLHVVVVGQDLAQVPDVMGDRVKLKQVFINVLSNALEAMPEGGRISLSTALNNGMVEARVADTGTGIAEENIPRVFDPFFTTKEAGAGTGLGLYLCYGIIKQHHGLIELASAVGRGTTVTIKIPERQK